MRRVGTLEFADGGRYTGDVARGVREGEGLMRWADGTEHRGGWSEGRPHGHGVRVSAAGDVVHSGEWSRGRVSGPCTRAHSNGDAYEGGCEGMARDGEGVCAFGNGDVYRGAWRDAIHGGLLVSARPKRAAAAAADRLIDVAIADARASILNIDAAIVTARARAAANAARPAPAASRQPTTDVGSASHADAFAIGVAMLRQGHDTTHVAAAQQ